MKHTPGKLEVVKLGPEALGVGIPVDGSLCREMIANPIPTRGNRQNMADMERLALCWNAHDDLLAALSRMVEVAKHSPHAINFDSETFDLARAAIAKATGGGS